MTEGAKNKLVWGMVPKHVKRELDLCPLSSRAAMTKVLRAVVEMPEFVSLGRIEVGIVPAKVVYANRMGELNLDYLYPTWFKISSPFAEPAKQIKVYVSADGKIRNSSGPESNLSVG